MEGDVGEGQRGNLQESQEETAGAAAAARGEGVLKSDGKKRKEQACQLYQRCKGKRPGGK